MSPTHPQKTDAEKGPVATETASLRRRPASSKRIVPESAESAEASADAAKRVARKRRKPFVL